MHIWKKTKARQQLPLSVRDEIVTWKCTICRRHFSTRVGNRPEEIVVNTSLGGTCEELVFRDVTES